ncbi:MAG: Hpt domain-containing protein [Alphaproteobacteria bacterium]|nr:Hpt domain-containing protein [Alphaproteobacteria bacterium]
MIQTASSKEQDIDSLAIIDEVHLTTFTDGDATLEEELGTLFIKTALGYVKRMKEALSAGRAWSAEAHALKGASGNLGARRVAALARRAELEPPSQDQIDAILSAIDDVESFFADRAP